MDKSTPNRLQGWPTWITNASYDHLHALGVIHLTYNRLEHIMQFLFQELMPVGKEISEVVFLRMSGPTRIDVIRSLSARQCKEVDDAINHALTCFSICTDNRNILAHIIEDFTTTPSEQFFVGRKKNANKTEDLIFLLDLGELREIADTAQAVYAYVMRLCVYLFREKHDTHQNDGEPAIDMMTLMVKCGPNALPEKPPRPNKLNPLQPPANTKT